MRAQKIFTSFLIILATTAFFLLPLTGASEELKTDTREDTFSVPTIVGQTTDNIVLAKAIYDSDTTTLTVVSDLSTDTVSWSSYNATDQHVLISGMTANTTRTLTATYDVDALNSTNLSTFSDALVWILLLAAGAFAPTALAAIWAGRV